MQSQHLAAAVGIAIAFSISGCGGGGGGGGGCTIALSSQETQKAKKMLHKDPDTVCAGVEPDCCTAINVGVQAAGNPKQPQSTAEKTKSAEALVGKCGKTDQVGLYNCVKKNVPPQFANSPYFSGDVEADSSTDGVGTCHASPPGSPKPMACDGVSTGCCVAVNAAIAKKPEVADYVGKCGKKDQDSLLKCGKAAHDIPGSTQAMLLAFSTQRTDSVWMPATKTSSADNAFDGTELQATAMVGFLAGATVFGLGALVYQQRARSSLEEPMIA